MKSICIKIVALAVMLSAGFAGLNAQNNKGNQYLRNQRGACVNSAGLSSEQKAGIQKLSDQHQAEMDALRTELRAANDPDARKDVRSRMDQSQIEHRNKISELGATTPNTPHKGYSGCGRGAGRGAGIGAGRAFGGGRGLGPCGAGLGRRR